MAKLYPPVIAGTIPAFYGTSLEVPFSMNRAVGQNEFNGFALKIKTVNGALVGTVMVGNADAWMRNHTIIFDLPTEIVSKLKIGEFYKVQLAYVLISDKNNATNIGLYSTIGVTKYTSNPSVTLEGLNPNEINNHIYNYQGVYRQCNESVQGDTIVRDFSNSDTTEKLYSSRFVLYDKNDNIVKDSGEILHNTTFDVNSYEATDGFMIPEDLELNAVYYIYYIATTVNGLVKTSPRYRITQRRQIPMSLEATISASLDYESGTVNIELKGNNPNQVASGQFLLSRRANSEENRWEEVFYFSLQSEVPDRILFKDYTVAQGVSYTYSLQQYNQNRVFSDRKLSNSVLADFEDLFLYDGERQLKVKFNPKVATFKSNVVETKTNTLGSKYPFITRNGHVDYKELSISGLISYQMDDIRNFMSWKELGIEQSDHNLVTENIKAERDFKLEVMDWLNNGEPKLFRSPTEGNYIVRLMNVTMSPTDTLGRMLHTFNCSAYEIDGYSYENLQKYGLISVDNDVHYQMRWATIELLQHDPVTGKPVYFTGRVNLGKNYGQLTERPVYYLSANEMMPGTYFLIGQDEKHLERIYIGVTGSYELQTNDPYLYVYIPEKDDNGNDIQWTGSITYGYKSQVTSVFDLITNVQINDVPDRRIMGYTGDSVLNGLQDIKTTILAIKYVTFTTRGYYPLYVSRSEFDRTKPKTWKFYTDSNNAAYYQNNAQSYLIGNTADYQIKIQDLASWNLYKIFYRRENYDYQEVNGEGYYVDREKEEMFAPFTGFYLDPLDQKLYEDDGTIFEINVNGEIADLTETQHLTISGIDNYDILKAGIGVVTDIGYQSQTSTYSFETESSTIAQFKQNYLTAVANYNKKSADGTLTKEDYQHVKESYAVFIDHLTDIVNKYKEENGVD